MLLGHLDSIVFLNLLYLLNWEFYKYPYRLQNHLLSFVILKKDCDGALVYTKSNFGLPRSNKKMGLFRLNFTKNLRRKMKKSLAQLAIKNPICPRNPCYVSGLYPLRHQSDQYWVLHDFKLTLSVELFCSECSTVSWHACVR